MSPVDDRRVQYVEVGGAHVAYMTSGAGVTDLVGVPEWCTHVELLWSHPTMASLTEALISGSRGIFFDRRGMGLSDPLPNGEVPTVGQWMDDLVAVLDAEGSACPAILGMGHGGQMAMMFAATHPERVSHLVLINTSARLMQDEDYPHGFTEAEHADFLDLTHELWGQGDTLRLLAPGLAEDPANVEWWGHFQRSAAGPSMARAMRESFGRTDVRHVLEAIQAPTLVMHSAGNQYVPVEHGRWLGSHLPGAEYVEVDTPDHWLWSGGDVGRAALARARDFISDGQGAPSGDRMLATILFTDIVGSTEQAADRGDGAWTELLDLLDQRVSRQVERFGGRVVKHTGDGHLAVFDRPGRAIDAAAAVREVARLLQVPVRSGLHTGEVERRGEDIAGVAVHLAARVMGEAGPNQVLVSGSVPPLVIGSGIEFADRGSHELKGIPGEWQVFEVLD